VNPLRDGSQKALGLRPLKQMEFRRYGKRIFREKV
jgi:hypothetical protein